ncbi:MAG TPA: TIGR01244 family sulfur transferase [Geminicoccaceae bacterium]|nr:TIGR01244 family sulfur transferase [Geminicoccaceae bacterium]
MSKFRQVTDTFWASPQIDLADIAEAQARGFALIVNNRPEGEADDQLPGSEIETAARAVGLDYLAIPVTHSGFSEDQVRAMADAIDAAAGPVLGYCRSGTRSTLLWSLAQALQGRAPEAIAADAARAGYDVAPIRPLLEMLASRSGA